MRTCRPPEESESQRRPRAVDASYSVNSTVFEAPTHGGEHLCNESANQATADEAHVTGVAPGRGGGRPVTGSGGSRHTDGMRRLRLHLDDERRRQFQELLRHAVAMPAGARVDQHLSGARFRQWFPVRGRMHRWVWTSTSER